MGRVNAVDPVIGIHHRPRLGFFHGNFKRREIDLADRALIDHFIDNHTERLLRVAGEVLKRVADALGLAAVDQACAHFAGKQRIF